MILAIDQGTTGTTCLVFDREGRTRPRLQRVRAALPAPGLGRARRRRDLGGDPAGRRREALADAGIEGRRASTAIGITNQRETVVAWDPTTGEPVHSALVWQDRRTAARCDELREAGHERAGPRAHRAGHRPLLLRRPRSSGCCATSTAPTGAVFGTIDSWLVFKLTGRHVTDYTNASRTLLFDIRELAGTPSSATLLGSTRERCPEPLPSAEVYGAHRGVRRRGAGGGDRRRPAGGAVRPGLPRARGWRRTPTAPAASCCSTPAPRRPSRARGC